MGKKTPLEQAQEDGLITGQLEDGQVIKVEEEEEEDEQQAVKKDEPPVKKERDLAAEFDALQQKLARLEGENAALRAPKQPAQKPQEPDWEELLFTDPKNAVALIKKSIRDELTNELTTTYKKDQGEKQFWDDFYKDHGDLKDDDDLVRTTLNKHLGELADLPVKKASEKLAELTRDRIMRYTNTTKGGKKAVTEGAGQPSPVKKAPEPNKVVTLSDIIKARRAKRLNPKATTA